ncbi:uncharacterized protein LOC141517203 [Macrotis lagotis]|uniref:uncharacterized protein LOC141517203 n=1 Tax=Macrotis lagotis TaxID=92651 RepID=UPI003D69FC80
MAPWAGVDPCGDGEAALGTWGTTCCAPATQSPSLSFKQQRREQDVELPKQEFEALFPQAQEPVAVAVAVVVVLLMFLPGQYCTGGSKVHQSPRRAMQACLRGGHPGELQKKALVLHSPESLKPALILGAIEDGRNQGGAKEGRDDASIDSGAKTWGISPRGGPPGGQANQPGTGQCVWGGGFPEATGLGAEPLGRSVLDEGAGCGEAHLPGPAPQCLIPRPRVSRVPGAPSRSALSPPGKVTVRAMTQYNLVVLGCCAVGKSALIIRLLQNRFMEESEHVVRDLYRGQLVVDGEPCQVAIMDTSGRELFQELREDCILWGQGFLFVYMVDCISTFVDMSLFWDQVQKIKGTSRVPMVLVANKVDLVHRMVDSEMGWEGAKSFGVPYVETSAKTGQGVEQAFRELVQEIQWSQDQGCRSRHCTIL